MEIYSVKKQSYSIVWKIRLFTPHVDNQDSSNSIEKMNCQY